MGHLDQTHNGWQLYHELMEMNRIGMKMREWGVGVDNEAMDVHQNALEATAKRHREEFYQLAPEGFYLGQAGQHKSLPDLFFKHLGVIPSAFSEITREASLDATTLQKTIYEADNPLARELAKHVLGLRQAQKLLSTYIFGLPISQRTGRVHPNWKPWGTVTGRWSSSEPNLQNQPPIMRNLFVPRPGNVIVGADYSALELRIIALLAKDELLLQWFRQGEDVHWATAERLFGKPRAELVKENHRNLAKIAEFSFNYNSSGDVTTALRQAQKRAPSLTMAQMKFLRKGWFRDHPAIAKWQLKSVAHTELMGYVEEPLSGRREYFHDGVVDENKCLNFPVQGFAATTMNRALRKLEKMVDWKHTAIVAQIHDAAYIEGPAKKLDEMKNMLDEAMSCTVEHEGETLPFTIEVHHGSDMRVDA